MELEELKHVEGLTQIVYGGMQTTREQQIEALQKLLVLQTSARYLPQVGIFELVILLYIYIYIYIYII